MEIGRLAEENQKLQANLNDSLTNNAVSQTKLSTLRTRLNETQTELSQLVKKEK